MKHKTAFKKFLASAAPAVVIFALGTGGGGAWEGNRPLIIDHQCTNLPIIPPEWFDSTKVYMRMYYGHTSHGSQVICGLEQVELADPLFAFEAGYRFLPADSGVFCVNDDYGITPDLYWKSTAGLDRTRAALNDNPSINISMFMWCIELNYYTEEETAAYLDSLELLEAEFPDVTFIYTTGNAQYAFGEGYNRWLRNEQIRAYCLANDKVLFDFADMDVWWYNPSTFEWETETYQYGEYAVPIEHPQYSADECGHTTLESCVVKGKSMWWLASMLSGCWADSTGTRETSLSDLKRRFAR